MMPPSRADPPPGALSGESMPNISSSTVNNNLVSATASDGASVTITKETIYAYHNNLAQSNEDLTRETVERYIAGLISNALGSANVLPDQIEFHYDPVTGSPTTLGFQG